MKDNVIILTTGLSGSSVLTGLIARGGYWLGESTHKKTDYDTFENEELIQLNRRLFRDAGFHGNSMVDFSPDALLQMSRAYGSIDIKPYREFLDKCTAHAPWIWKDPQLWLTIRYWQHLLDLKHCKFILLTRSYTQWWISATLRGQIRSFSSFKRYELAVQRSINEFFQQSKASSIHLRYEDLILRPEETLRKLNDYLGTNLALGDLAAVYTKPLYKLPKRSVFDQAKAVLIYAKNYSHRIDVSGERAILG